MKVLIIHQHFRWPEDGGALRSYYIAKGLQRLGKQVIVLTASSVPRQSPKQFDGIIVRSLRVKYDNSFGFVRRLMAYSLFVIKAILHLRNYRDCDVAYVMSTPLTVGIIGLFGKSLYNIPFVFEAGDLWPDVPIQMGIIRHPFFRWFTLRLEKVIYGNAKFVVALSDAMKVEITSKTKTDVVTIESFSDTEFFDAVTAGSFKPEGIPDESFVISYIGTLGVANKVEKLIGLSNHLTGANIHVVIQGRGKELSHCQKIAFDLKLPNVHFLPFGNKNDIRDLLAYSDAIFICFDSRFPLLTTGCPNKLMDGLAAGKIIFINYQGWQKELIEKNDCGAFINTDSPETGSEVVKEVLHDVIRMERLKKNSKILARSFQIEVLTEKLSRRLENSISKDRAYTRNR